MGKIKDMNKVNLKKIIISFLIVVGSLCSLQALEINASDMNRTVYVARSTGGFYHYSSICGTMRNPYSMTLKEAIDAGKKPCSKCVNDSDPTPTTTPETYAGFIDVDSKTAHAENIAWLAETGISQGWTEADGSKTFRPYANVARADMSAFLNRLAGVLGDTSAAEFSPSGSLWSTFIDVLNEENKYHQTDILWLADSGISQGWTEADGSKTFRPFNSVARADMAAFLKRLAVKYNIGDAQTWVPSEEDWNTFTDVLNEEDKYHQEDILWLAHAGISEGWTEDDGTKTFRPFNAVARADMAAFLQRLANLAA